MISKELVLFIYVSEKNYSGTLYINIGVQVESHMWMLQNDRIVLSTK